MTHRRWLPKYGSPTKYAGEVMVLAILGALMFRERTGRGQCLEGSVHEAVSKITETGISRIGSIRVWSITVRPVVTPCRRSASRVLQRRKMDGGSSPIAHTPRPPWEPA